MSWLMFVAGMMVGGTISAIAISLLVAAAESRDREETVEVGG